MSGESMEKRISRIGIPRAMGYYYLYPFFRAMLLALDAEPVLSPPTNARIIEHMDCCPTDEPCLAVKLHFSHADTLAQRDDIDFLFLPSIVRVDDITCCPKFIGIADMTRHGLGLADERVLMPVIDYSENDQAMQRALQPLARRLGITNRDTLRAAICAGRAAQQQFTQLCIDRRLTTVEAYRLLESGVPPPPPPVGGGPAVGVIGHPYIIYELVSQDMIQRLREYGPVITAEMLPAADAMCALATIREGARMWPFEGVLLGAALHLLRTRAVEKMILVGSFECGPESIIESYIAEEAERQGIPLMVLTLDEHSGEAGLTTRLEAFMDTEKHAAAPPQPPLAPPALPHQEMIIGFPSMGHLDVTIHTFLSTFGTRMLPTPRSTPACIELGREIAPEFACFPLSATLGQLRYLLDQGANTLLMVGGKGYCRLGWYAQVQEKLLRNMGYQFQLLIVDSFYPLKEKWPTFRHTLKSVSNGASWGRIISVLNLGYQQLAMIDRAEQLLHRLRAYERVQGAADRIVARFIRRVSQLQELHAMQKLEREFLEEAATVETEETDPLHLRITGEIWVVLEQAITRDVERWLGTRARPRVWVHRDLSASAWFRYHVLKLPAAVRQEHALRAAAHPWLAHKVGGHGQSSVGNVALARREGMDGVLHIFPFTCMPEIIAQNIMVPMSEQLDIPVLTYIVSEQTGEAGMETRLESFLDLLEERRAVKEKRTPGKILLTTT